MEHSGQKKLGEMNQPLMQRSVLRMMVNTIVERPELVDEFPVLENLFSVPFEMDVAPEEPERRRARIVESLKAVVRG